MTSRKGPGVGWVIPAGLAAVAAMLLVVGPQVGGLLVDRQQVGGLRVAPVPFDRVVATVTTPDGARHELCLWHAETAEQHRRGLMGMTGLDGCDGMVFSFSADTEQPFWMRDTRLPLSVAYFDGRGRLVSTADMAPCGDRADCPRYPPTGPYRYALEVPQGQLAASGVTPGARLLFTGRTC